MIFTFYCNSVYLHRYLRPIATKDIFFSFARGRLNNRHYIRVGYVRCNVCGNYLLCGLKESEERATLMLVYSAVALGSNFAN